jgi:hypothetical protein
LTLVPVRPGDDVALGDRVTWVRRPDGWQGEVGLTYPDALFHAHYRVDLSSPLLVLARSTLLLAGNLLVLTLLWTLGRVLRHGRRPAWTEWRGLFVSFRARVTLALFAFFVLSNAIFGTLAYRTLTDAAERTARVLAERVAIDASSFYLEVQGEMDLLARRAGADVTHVDASRTALAWARENAELSGLSGSSGDGLRWVLDDALAFARREARRGASYTGILLDPPHYGRGPKGEKWQLETGLVPLLEACGELLAARSFLVLSSYAVGYSAQSLANLLGELPGGDVEAGELVLAEESAPGRAGRLLPCGFAARWARGLA